LDYPRLIEHFCSTVYYWKHVNLDFERKQGGRKCECILYLQVTGE